MNNFTQKNENLKHGICPFMSTAMILPVQQKANITDITGQPQVVPGITHAPCVGVDCQLFDNDVKRCSIVSTPYLTNAFETLARAKT